MRRFWLIWVLLALTLAACQRPTPLVETVYLPSQRLVTIDTLMQSQPDSALTLLLDSTMDDPYYQLLLSEALYKNDYSQTNCSELLDAMGYFDSINDPFLAARCHYMNGVSYYEMDSVVPACAEYMKALEIMEEHFEEKDLVGYKAKFMALTYTHLFALFSDQYLSEHAIYFGKHALVYYQKYDAEPWHVAWVLSKIGAVDYYMREMGDSALFYYNKALDVLSDTNNLTYRDIRSGIALITYYKEKKPEKAIQQIKYILDQAESDLEFQTRCLLIGDIYYKENMWDSAWLYLNTVFNSIQDTDSKIIAAQELQNICLKTGDSLYLNNYEIYLSQQAKTSDNKALLHSRLFELYHGFTQKRNNSHQETIFKKSKIIIATLLFAILITAVSLLANRKQLKHVKRQIEAADNKMETERTVHQMQQAALSGRLRKSNKQLRETSQQLENYLNSPNVVEDNKTLVSDYDALMREGFCINLKQRMKEVEKFSSFDVKSFKSLALTKREMSDLFQTIDRHCPNFSKTLLDQYPSLNAGDLKLCRLYLFDFSIIQVAVLLGTDYSSIRKRTNRLKEKTCCKELTQHLKSILFK